MLNLEVLAGISLHRLLRKSRVGRRQKNQMSYLGARTLEIKLCNCEDLALEARVAIKALLAPLRLEQLLILSSFLVSIFIIIIYLFFLNNI